MGNKDHFRKREEQEPILYVSNAGFELFEFSYSLANEMARCGKYVELKRIKILGFSFEIWFLFVHLGARK